MNEQGSPPEDDFLWLLEEDEEPITQEEEALRPKKRADCEDVPRPCPWVSCRYNLALDINPQTGEIQLNPHYGRGISCAIDLALEGEHSLGEIGVALGVTKEWIRQVELKGLIKMYQGLFRQERAQMPGFTELPELLRAKLREERAQPKEGESHAQPTAPRDTAKPGDHRDVMRDHGGRLPAERAGAALQLSGRDHRAGAAGRLVFGQGAGAPARRGDLPGLSAKPGVHRPGHPEAQRESAVFSSALSMGAGHPKDRPKAAVALRASSLSSFQFFSVIEKGTQRKIKTICKRALQEGLQSTFIPALQAQIQADSKAGRASLVVRKEYALRLLLCQAQK